MCKFGTMHYLESCHTAEPQHQIRVRPALRTLARRQWKRKSPGVAHVPAIYILICCCVDGELRNVLTARLSDEDASVLVLGPGSLGF